MALDQNTLLMCQNAVDVTRTDRLTMKQRARVKHYNNDYLQYYGKCSDDSEEDMELPARNAKKPQNYVEADVLSGDTLQAVALRFNCSVEALKKANNIHKENEIFAKGKLKIPISAFSLLTENLPSVHTSGNNSPTKVRNAEPLHATKLASPSDSDLQQKLIIAAVNTAEVRPSLPKHLETVTANKTYSDSNIISVNGVEDETLLIDDDTVPLFAQTSIPVRPSVEQVVVNEFTKKGDNFGFKWFHLLTLAVLLVIVPVIVVFYIFEHPEKYKHHHD